MSGTAPLMGMDDASCVYIPRFLEMPPDQLGVTIANIIIGAISILSLLYYGVHSYFSACGWEEVYVCIVELFKVFIEVFLEYCTPVTFYERNNNHIVWIRYAEWLLTCPVILIHLSNITGLADDYSKRTMTLLVSDIGTIVFGVTAALASGYVKLACFLLGVCYGIMTFKAAGQIHLEAFYAMPRGRCRALVGWMAAVFFSSWLGYPVLFMLGQEGFFRVLSPWGSVLGHCIVDVLSKNLWGFLGHHLRISVHEHIALHGLVRAPRKHKVLGLFELEVEQFVDDENISGAVRSSMAGLAHRRSLQKVRSQLMAQGRACCDLDAPPQSPGPSAPGNGGPPFARVFPPSIESEFILPSQFLLGSPKWHNSMGGVQQRVHPSDDSGHNRAASLDWPGWMPEGKPAEEPAASGGNADALAAVRVRSKASVGTGAPKT